MCLKRAFDNVKQARLANRKANFRVKVYWCGECRRYHVSNLEKR